MPRRPKTVGVHKSKKMFGFKVKTVRHMPLQSSWMKLQSENSTLRFSTFWPKWITPRMRVRQDAQKHTHEATVPALADIAGRSTSSGWLARKRRRNRIAAL